jgi:glycosyltransferase involved in cell wall biosynthesis
MRFSVVIPAYNAAATIDATVQSVLAQTLSPLEILVLDDGSTDETFLRLEAYGGRITVIRQPNSGVAKARNVMCERARGDLIAFLDADDIWHPSYLEMQSRIIQEHPDAVAYFTLHENFTGYGDYKWDVEYASEPTNPESINPLQFIKEYNNAPLHFQMSCFCIRKRTLEGLGNEPFLVSVSGADDTYLHNLLPLSGTPVVHLRLSLVAYRIIGSSISSNRLKMSLSVVRVFELLDELYRTKADPELLRAFKDVYASRIRNCGKFLMGASRTTEARKKFFNSVRVARSPRSLLKSLALLGMSYLPRNLQPRWPSSFRPESAADSTRRVLVS